MRYWFLSVSIAWVAPLAIAQPGPSLTCTASSGVPPVVRAEGLTELAGDYLLTCTGGAAGITTNFNLTLFFNTNVTNRVPPGATETLLLIDDPPPASQVLSVNAFQGVTTSSTPNSVLWSNIPITAPGAGAYRTLRFVNVRVNAQAIGGSSGGVPTQVLAFLSASPALLVNNPQQIAAYVQSGVEGSVGACDGAAAPPPTLSGIFGSNPDLTSSAGSSGATQLSVRFRELFPSAFKLRYSTRGLPGESESGVGQSSPISPSAAQSGTRFLARFGNVPAGVRIFVTTSATGGGLSASLINAEASGAGFASPVTGVATGVCPANRANWPVAEIPLIAGAGVAVWEVTASDPAILETAVFGVAVRHPADFSPASGPVTVEAGFAPINNTAGPSSVAPIPRFQTVLVSRPAFGFGGAAEPPQILTTSPLPSSSGTVNLRLDAAGGSPPYYWSASGLPPSLTLAPDGALTGSAAPGPYSFTARVIDSLGLSSSRAFSLTIAASSSLTAVPTSLSFRSVAGGPAAPPQAVLVGSTGAPIPFTTAVTSTNPGFGITLSPQAGTTPASLSIGVTAGLPPGTYSGDVRIIPMTSPSVPLTVPVVLTVTPPLTASPSSLSFTYERGGAVPASRTLAVTAGSTPVNVTAATSTVSGVPWLRVSPGAAVTPATFTVAVQAEALAAGVHDGVITIQALPGSAPTIVTVRLIVTDPPPLIVSPTATFVFDHSGNRPPSQTFSVTSRSGATIPFTATPVIVSPQRHNWLTVVQSHNTTPATVTLSANPSGLGLGRFLGYIIYQTPQTVIARQDRRMANGDTPQATATFLTSVQTGPLIPVPDRLEFTSGPPSSVMVPITSPGRVPFIATPTTVPPDMTPQWLSVDPRNATSPVSLNVAVALQGLSPDSYTGHIALQDNANTPNGATIDVGLTINGPMLRLETGSLTFRHRLGDAPPSPINVAVTGVGTELPFAAQSTANWLRVAPSTGRTPGSLAVSVDVTGMPAGAHPGAIKVTSPDAVNGEQDIAVTLIVNAGGAPRPSITSPIMNSAGLKPGPVAAGSLVTLKGAGLADDIDQATAIPLPQSLRTTSVSFNGIPAPLLYVSDGQINAQLPWEVLPGGARSGSASVVVTRGGVASDPVNFQVEPVSPGLFALGFETGQAVAINPDATLAAPVDSVPGLRTHPATVGSLIQLLGSGLGAADPPGRTGQDSLDALRRTLTVPVVLIGGVEAEVRFSGLTPQFPGVNQINVIVPNVAPGDRIPVQIRVGGVTTTDQITMAVGR